MARDLREAATGRERFDDFRRKGLYAAAIIFARAGYSKIQTLRQMQENARAFCIQNLRKLTPNDAPPIGVRLALDLISVFHMQMKSIKDPTIEEVQIPNAMSKWAPSLTSLTGVIAPDQDMVNYFAIEMTRGALEIPPYAPFVTGDLSATPWMPAEPIYTREHETWKKLQTTRKRPPNQPTSFQAFVLNYIRFVLSRDLAGAWANFGGLAAQLSHLGALLSISATEDAMTAIAYDKAVRSAIETSSRKRISDQERKKFIDMLLTEHDQTKKAVVRGVAALNTSHRTNPAKQKVIKTQGKEYKKAGYRKKGGKFDKKGGKGDKGGGKHRCHWGQGGYRRGQDQWQTGKNTYGRNAYYNDWADNADKSKKTADNETATTPTGEKAKKTS